MDEDTNLLNAMNKTKKYIETLKSKYRFLSDPLVSLYFKRVNAEDIISKEK